MLDSDVFNRTLSQRNDEIDTLKRKYEETVNKNETKVFKLMETIKELKEKNATLEDLSHENKKVEVIKSLRNEKKDQDLVISLLRKYVHNDAKIDKYLMNEYKKSNETKYISYDELSQKYKILDNTIKKIKLNIPNEKTIKKKGTSTINKRRRSSIYMDDDAAIQLKVNEKFKEQINEYENQIQLLQIENDKLIKAKEKMQDLHNKLLQKLRNYNKESDKMNSVYNIIKKDLKDESDNIINDLNINISIIEKENEKLKDRIYELLNIGDNWKKEDNEKIINLRKQIDNVRKDLDIKKGEALVYKEELEKFKKEFGKHDTLQEKKYSKINNEMDNINKNKDSLKKDIKKLKNIVKEKNEEIQNLRSKNDELTEDLEIKDKEIDLLNEKINEFENIFIINRKKNNNKNNK